MFAAPKEIEATVFVTLPDDLKVRGRTSGWSFGKGGHSLHSFLEGPSFDRDGNLYVVDIPYGRVLRVSPAAKWEVVAEYDGWPNGLKIHKDGRIFIADHLYGIMELDAATGKVTPVLTTIRREGLKGVNDLVFASNGDIYFTDQGQTGLQDPSGRVYRMAASGRIDCLIDRVPSPNGLVLTPDEKTLLVRRHPGQPDLAPAIACGRHDEQGRCLHQPFRRSCRTGRAGHRRGRQLGDRALRPRYRLAVQRPRRAVAASTLAGRIVDDEHCVWRRRPALALHH